MTICTFLLGGLGAYFFYRIARLYLGKILTFYISRYIIEVDKNHYIVHYPFGTEWYKIKLVRKRKPCTIWQITNEKGENVSEYIYPYMGPSKNFHNLHITPGELGYETLTFTYYDGEIITFEKQQNIVV